MALFWIILGLAILIVVGNALILLRSAKTPRIPPGVKPQPYEDDES